MDKQTLSTLLNFKSDEIVSLIVHPFPALATDYPIS